MSGASACIAALRQVRKVVDELGRLPRNLAVEAAPEITRMLKAQFRVGVDPYGNRWAPLAPATIAKGRQNPPLTDTHRLADGTEARPMTGGRAGLTIRIGAPYGAFAQTGFRVGKTRVPPRRILPSRGMPAAWREILVRKARELAAKARGAR